MVEGFGSFLSEEKGNFFGLFRVDLGDLSPGSFGKELVGLSCHEYTAPVFATDPYHGSLNHAP